MVDGGPVLTVHSTLNIHDSVHVFLFFYTHFHERQVHIFWGKSVAPACSAALNSAFGDESLRRRYICGLRRPPHNHNVHAIRCPAGIRQGTPGSKYGGLGSAQFLAGRRGQRRSSLWSGLRYAARASTDPIKMKNHLRDVEQNAADPLA